MNKFTKSMTAIAVSALVAGPAAALEFDATYAGEKGQIKFSGNGCDTDKLKNVDVVMSFINGFGWDFGDFVEIGFESGPDTGYWESSFFSFGEEVEGLGMFIISKPGKTSLDAPKEAVNDISDEIADVLELVLGDYALFNCKNVDLVGIEPTTIKKFDTKWSKDGEKVDVKFEANTKYLDDKGKEKKVQLSVKTGKMDLIDID